MSFQDKHLTQKWKHTIQIKNLHLEDCTLLHFAIAEHDDKSVQRLLERGADVRDKASYTKEVMGRTIHVEVEAIHIAVNYNNLRALERLLAAYRETPEAEGDPDGSRYLNSWTRIREEGGGDFVDFYQPIHDAGFLGHKDLTLWLLQHRVEVNAQSKDGVTPLHFAASRGGRAALTKHEDVKALVTFLLDERADLQMRTREAAPYPIDESRRDKTAFEWAVDNDQFPVEMLVLLHEATGNKMGFLPRLSWFMKRNRQEEAVRYIEERLQLHDEMEALLKEVQEPGAVDELAGLLFRAPRAAVRLLDLLTMSPITQDCVPARTLLQCGPMLCSYQTDSTVLPNKVRWPLWTSSFSLAVVQHDSEPAWHKEFFPEDLPTLPDRVYPVDVKVVMVPDILDVDVCMALTRTWASDLEIFAHLPIQGLIHCWWEKVVYRSFLLNLSFMTVELAVLLYWGLADGASASSLGQASGHTFGGGLAPLCWFVLLVGFWREMLVLFLSVWTHYEKYRSYKKEEVLKVLWDPSVFWSPGSDSWFIGSCILLFTKLFFLVFTSVTHYAGYKGDMDEAMLAGSALLQILRISFMLRLTHRFKLIIPIAQTFASRANLDMLLLASMLFLSFVFFFQMHLRDSSFDNSFWFSFTYLYRGLMFGDGDGLNRMGLRVCKPGSKKCLESAQQISLPLWLAMFSATVVFNVAVVNLMTAIYSSKYDEIKCRQDLHFQLERAKYSLVHVQIVQLMDKLVDKLRNSSQLDWRMLCSVLVVPLVAISIFVNLPRWAKELLLAALLALFVALALVFGQAYLGHSDWKHEAPEKSEAVSQEVELLEPPRFVWICHRKDFDPKHFDQDPVTKQDLEATNEQLHQLQEQSNRQLGRLQQDLDQVHKRLGELHSLLEGLVGREQPADGRRREEE